MTKARHKPASNTVRIIGGEFRGRKLTFADVQGLRPTTDRVRETVFNWLQQAVPAARCLDLYAGSGAMGFEALSRGAAHVDFVDVEQKVCRDISANFKTLRITNAGMHCQGAEKFLAVCSEPYDLVFLDPPFQQNLLNDTLTKLIDRQLLRAGACIYLEAEFDLAKLTFPPGWVLSRHKKAGNVYYGLLVSEDV